MNEVERRGNRTLLFSFSFSQLFFTFPSSDSATKIGRLRHDGAAAAPLSSFFLAPPLDLPPFPAAKLPQAKISWDFFSPLSSFLPFSWPLQPPPSSLSVATNQQRQTAFSSFFLLLPKHERKKKRWIFVSPPFSFFTRSPQSFFSPTE